MMPLAIEEEDVNRDLSSSQRWRDLRDAAAFASHLIREADDAIEGHRVFNSEALYAWQDRRRSARMLRALALREMRAQGRRDANRKAQVAYLAATDVR